MRLFCIYILSELVSVVEVFILPNIHSRKYDFKSLYLISGVNETRYLVQHELCYCKYGLNETAWNSLQKWNHDECRCECKELNDWCFRINNYIWLCRLNISACECECNKACKFDKCLGIKNCSCEKSIFDKLLENKIKTQLKSK